MCKFICKVAFSTTVAVFLLLVSLILYAYNLDTNFEFDSRPWASFDIKLPKSTKNLKVAFISIGSRGDYQPISLVAKEFKQNGHTVLIPVRDRYRYLMTDILGFTDNEILWIPDEEGRVAEEVLGNPQRVVNVVKQSFTFFEFFNKETERYLDMIFSDKRFDDIDLIVTQEYIMNAALILSKKWKAPLISLKYSPIATTTDEYSVFSPRSSYTNPSIFNWLEFQIFNILAIYCQHDLFENILAIHNLPQMPIHKLYYGKLRYEIPSYFLISNAIYPELKRKPKWWKYFGPVFNEEKSIPTETEAFLEKCKNETIVYVGFGSLSLRQYYGNDSYHTASVIFNTISRLDFCAVFLNATFKISPKSKEALNPKFHYPNHVPQTLVFPKVDLIIHHGGTGTNQIAAASGRITISIPIFEEQRINCRFTSQYGLLLMLENSELSEATLESAILKALQVKDISEKAQKIKDSVLGTRAIYDDILSWL